MSAIARLQAKIEQLKSKYEATKNENKKLKSQLETLSDGNDFQETIERLQNELNQRDKEIDEIVAKVESLLK
jgi:archaellum component FlaC